MKTITLLIEKGGVGKTTLSTLLATLLAQRGNKVLLVDADHQGHATLSVRSKRRDGLYNLLKANAPFQDVVVPVAPDFYGGSLENPTLWLLPSADNTSKLTNDLDIRVLKARLGQVAQAFDYCVIDTAPSISDLHYSFYLASDYIIYPTECAFGSMQSLSKSISHLQSAQAESVKHGYPIAQVLGIVPTKFNGREAVQHENHGYLMGKYEGYMLSPIRRLADWEKAAQLRIPINMLGFKTPATKEAERFVDEVLAKIEVRVG